MLVPVNNIVIENHLLFIQLGYISILYARYPIVTNNYTKVLNNKQGYKKFFAFQVATEIRSLIMIFQGGTETPLLGAGQNPSRIQPALRTAIW